jgi:plasmid stabilization system protein ParE
MKYIIKYSKKAREDILNLTNHISFIYKAPTTSVKYMNELFRKINGLFESAESYPLYNRKQFSKHGLYVRRINYKKMAIIYTVHENTVLIQRIIPGSVIIET